MQSPVSVLWISCTEVLLSNVVKSLLFVAMLVKSSSAALWVHMPMTSSSLAVVFVVSSGCTCCTPLPSPVSPCYCELVGNVRVCQMWVDCNVVLVGRQKP
jgi:hypothetical protein